MKTCKQCNHSINPTDLICDFDDCDCICFIPETGSLFPAVNDWKETALLNVLDMLMGEMEGSVTVQTRDGRECRIEIGFNPDIGYSITAHGGKA